MDRCETYNPVRDMVSIMSEAGRQLNGNEDDGQCERKATRLLTFSRIKQMKLCGHCARGWKKCETLVKIDKI
jgi:hypothetical protein